MALSQRYLCEQTYQAHPQIRRRSGRTRLLGISQKRQHGIHQLEQSKASRISQTSPFDNKSRYNLPMPMTAAEIREAARQLPADEREWLLQTLQEDEFAAWQKEAGEPEPGYEEWFRASVEEALADDSPGIPHEEVMKETAEIIRAARERQRLKASA